MKYTELKDYLKEHGDEIKEQIWSWKYKPSPVRSVEISKESGEARYIEFYANADTEMKSY